MKGIIFDMDGTMVDNMMVHHRAWQKQLALLGLSLSLEEVRRTIHGINTEILTRLFGNRFSMEEKLAISDQKEAAYRDIFEKELKLIDGLSDFLLNCKENGIPMAIGTAAPAENVNFVLDKLHLRPFFSGIFHAGDVTKGKPDPQIFLNAADSLGLSPSDCLVFEDSPTGAEAALRAGCKSIILTTTHTISEFNQFPNIISFANHFRELSVSSIKEMWK